MSNEADRRVSRKRPPALDVQLCLEAYPLEGQVSLPTLQALARPLLEDAVAALLRHKLWEEAGERHCDDEIPTERQPRIPNVISNNSDVTDNTEKENADINNSNKTGANKACRDKVNTRARATA